MGGGFRTRVWWDSETGFWINSTSISYPDATASGLILEASEWLLSFGSNGTLATPPLCSFSPLNVSWPDASGLNATTTVFRNAGSFASQNDYAGLNVTLHSPGVNPPIPPLLNNTRVWGDVYHHDTTTPAADACRNACLADGPSCGGMAFSQLPDPSLNGCWLVTSVTQLTDQVGFTSWVSQNASSSTTWAPSGGRSSNGELPLFTVASGGVGRTISVGWSGNWEATVSRESDGTTLVSVAHPVLCATVAPGDAFRSMRILQVRWMGRGILSLV